MILSSRSGTTSDLVEDRRQLISAVLVRPGVGAWELAIGAGVTTSYTYDVGNRLAQVATTAVVSGSTVTQNRFFTYDRRGFSNPRPTRKRAPPATAR